MRVQRIVFVALAALVAEGVLSAQVGRGWSDWVTAYGDAQRTSWRERHARLGVQRQDLAHCLDTLLAEAAAGRAYWRVYRQFKMYNDAALNPYLRGR